MNTIKEYKLGLRAGLFGQLMKRVWLVDKGTRFEKEYIPAQDEVISAYADEIERVQEKGTKAWEKGRRI